MKNKIIVVSGEFKIHFKWCKKSIKDFVTHYNEAVDKFIENKQSINDHELKKELIGLRSFSVTDDIRVVYKETKNKLVFLRVGPHNKVY